MDSSASHLLALQRATHVILQALTHELADLGLGASEINVLAILSDGRGRTVAEIGAESGTRPTTMTGVLDRLQTRGYLVRRPDEHDRRAMRIDLTPSGAETARTVWAAVSRVEHEAFAACSPEQLLAYGYVARLIAERPR